MKQVRVEMLSVLMVLLCSLFSQGQQSVATNTNVVVPPLVNFSGILTDVDGKPLTGVVGVTFLLYQEQQGGSPLWMETQNVEPDSDGHYRVMLGSTSSTGLPADIFVSGQAHWLGVQVQRQDEQPRVLLVSAPYALKAVDAETLGGLPASAFVLAAPPNGAAATYTTESATAQSVSPATATDVTTTGGTPNYLPVFNAAATVIDSVLYQSGTGTTAKIGINTATPATTLDVKGAGTIRGTLSLPATAKATASAGTNSQPLNLAASAFNSSSSTALNQTFHLQAEPASNDTTAPSGTLNLLFGTGATKPSETGLHIASNGQITFAAGQTFPGTGSGTVTSVATGLGLKGGPITSSGTLTIDKTVVPRLGAANTFTGNQTLNGTLTAASSGSTIVAGTSNASDPAIQGNGISWGIEGNASTTNGTGIFGSGADGVVGQSGFANGSGLFGTNTSTTGSASGTVGETSSAAGFGVWGTNNSTTGNAVGVFGSTSSAAGYGVEGSVSAPNGAAVVAVNNSTTGNAFGLFASSASANGFGVEGTAPVGVYGVDSLGSAVGVLGQTNSGAGVQGQASSGNGVNGISSAGKGVYGQTASPTGYGVEGYNSATTGNAIAVYGESSTGYGVYGTGGISGVYGTGGPYGVWGNGSVGVYGKGSDYGVFASSPVWGVYAVGGVGVWGGTADVSNTADHVLYGSGAWGDTGDTSGDYVGVIATADANIAALVENNDSTGDYPTMMVENNTTATHNPVFQTSSPNTYSNTRHCTIDTSANLTCTGVVSGVIQADDGKQTAVYAMQSAENWFEDAGSGQLSNGSARIELESAFAQTVNAGVEYHVFLTPNGDSKGLYVSQKTATSFEVHEQGGGTSSIAFDYRIMAKRKGYENVRLEDLTDRFNKHAAPRKKTRPPLPSADTKSAPKIPAPAVLPLVAPRPIQPRPLAPMPVLPHVAPLPHPAQAGKPEVNQK